VSLPSIVGAGGIEGILPLHLSDEEMSGLRASARVVKDAQDLISAP
jgi:malate/lactate dehydrogenase